MSFCSKRPLHAMSSICSFAPHISWHQPPHGAGSPRGSSESSECRGRRGRCIGESSRVGLAVQEKYHIFPMIFPRRELEPVRESTPNHSKTRYASCSQRLLGTSPSGLSWASLSVEADSLARYRWGTGYCARPYCADLCNGLSLKGLFRVFLSGPVTGATLVVTGATQGWRSNPVFP